MIAAPIATTSSGFHSMRGTLPKKASTRSCTYGMRLEPPTRITLPKAETSRRDCRSASSQTASVRSTKGLAMTSSSSRVSS